MQNPPDGPLEPRPQVDQLLADLLRRADAGEPLEPEQWARDYPEFAEELREYFDTVELVDRLAGPILSPEEELAAAACAADPPLGRILGDYELLEELGRGGMGVVYKARQISLDRIVAVKVILAGAWASETDLKRFHSEARAAAQLEHPHIVGVYQVGKFEGHHYFSMDYIDGCGLDELARENVISSASAARYVQLVAEAIHAAHEHGILHRDLKPANVLIDRHDQPHVADFGLAKHLTRDGGLTATGAMVGTPSYMAPEQAEGKEATRASDVYSLGAILYVLLAGEPPFQRTSLIETITDVIHREPPAPSSLRSGIDRNLEAICLKCLHKVPARRYVTAQALADDLARFRQHQPVLARPVSRWQRGVRWVSSVPVVAALRGRTVTRPTAGQQRAQWLALSVVLAATIAFLVWRTLPARPRPLPDEIRVASAIPGGEYHEFSLALQPVLAKHTQRPVKVIDTSGSQQNSRLLLDGEADLALLQSGALDSEQVVVVAPLYYDLVFVVVRRSSGIARVSDLVGRKISIGLDGSGMQLSATQILSRLDIDPKQFSRSRVHFTDLGRDASYAAAIVTTGAENNDLKHLLATGEFRLVGLSEEETEKLVGPIYSPRTVRRGSLVATDQSDVVPNADIRTVATTTFLAVKRNAPDLLVTKTLEALYVRSNLVASFRLIPRAEVAQWKTIELHPAARKFFAEQRTVPLDISPLDISPPR